MEIQFVRLKKSSAVIEAIEDRMTPIFEKANIDYQRKVKITVAMENSPVQAGPDLFRVRMRIKTGIFRNLIVEKADMNFYKALSSLAESVSTTLQRNKGKRATRFARSKRNVRYVENF